MKCPYWKLEVEEYRLPPIEKGVPTGSNGYSFIARGGVAVKSDGYGPETQYVQIEIYDDVFSILPDDLLANPDCTISKHPLSIRGMIIPYEITFVLWKDANGHIVGDLGSSGQSTARIYQRLVLEDEHESDRTNVDF